MKILSNSDYDLFQKLVGLTQKEVLQAMNSYLKKHYKKVIATKNYIIAEGDIPIGLVAHMDTVFSVPATEIFYDRQKNVLWSPQGLGADDRAGIFAILKLVRSGYRPHIILTCDEERGAIGASKLIHAYEKYPFGELKYIIQLDRRGVCDCVFYDCDNPKFVDYVESFGFVEAWGSFSDISVICPKWKIAGVNLSVGYEDEHSYVERLYLNAFRATYDRVKKMLDDAENSLSYVYIPRKSKYIHQTNLHALTGCKCEKCGMPYDDYELLPVITKNGSLKMTCVDCISISAQWCDVCGEIFEVSEEEMMNSYASGYVCPECKGETK